MIRNILLLLLLLFVFLLFFFCFVIGLEKKIYTFKSLCCLNPEAFKGKRVQMSRDVDDDNNH